MRKAIAFVIFVFVLISFFYQYKNDENVNTEENKSKVSAQNDASGVTPKSENIQSDNQTSSNSVELEKDMFSIHYNDIVIGNRDAKIVVIEYSSPTCPHCAYFHKEVYPELKKKYIDTGKVAYVIREFVANKQDLDAAILSRCLDDKKDPMKLLDVLYTKQDNWAFNKNYREILENIGQLAGVSKEKYASCLANNDLVQMLANNSRSITFYKEFVGTPGFVIDGKMHKGVYDVFGLSSSIDKALGSK